VDREERLALIRPKLAQGQIPLVYDANSMTLHGHGGDGTLCKGCDEPIRPTDTYSVSYATPTDRHCFHILCDAARSSLASMMMIGPTERPRR